MADREESDEPQTRSSLLAQVQSIKCALSVELRSNRTAERAGSRLNSSNSQSTVAAASTAHEALSSAD